MSDHSPDLVVETPWIWRARRPRARLRLICFPHAGAGAGAYGEWARLLPSEIELAAVQLPGRQNRIAEDPVTEVGPLVKVLTQALRPVLDGDFAFFGHSGGAALAYEVAKALREKGGPRPSQLFLSAQPAPGTVGRVPVMHTLSDEELGAEVVRLGGIEPEIAEDEEVMEGLLPTLRADFSLWERHQVRPGAALDTPITVLSGDADPRAPKDTLYGWAAHTTGAFRTRFYPGGHFYFLDDPTELVAYIGQALGSQSLGGQALGGRSHGSQTHAGTSSPATELAGSAR
ncbi:thioesterase II family protein [Streptomyces sp. NBC_01314]|uniref:thioesterase II family protein n=1 Tax=Streptomyces sp. NBC_01314 TaxID=2903821 RepID=UPI00308F5198|nr:alpha/beta fold hydrolase [Streptomyces sp. NBC_01314]